MSYITLYNEIYTHTVNIQYEKNNWKTYIVQKFNDIDINFKINTDKDIQTYSEFVALNDEFSKYQKNFDDFIIKKYDNIYILKKYLIKTIKYIQIIKNIFEKLSKFNSKTHLKTQV
jgi:hypothetical protein